MKFTKQYLFAIVFVPFLVISNLDASRGTLQVGDVAPKIRGSEWINSSQLSSKDLAGHVVLVEFWTYG
jgi:hypothetical protein